MQLLKFLGSHGGKCPLCGAIGELNNLPQNCPNGHPYTLLEMKLLMTPTEPMIHPGEMREFKDAEAEILMTTGLFESLGEVVG